MLWIPHRQRLNIKAITRSQTYRLNTYLYLVKIVFLFYLFELLINLRLLVFLKSE